MYGYDVRDALLEYVGRFEGTAHAARRLATSVGKHRWTVWSGDIQVLPYGSGE